MIPAPAAGDEGPGSASGGQRRYVTVLFSDVSGSSEHAERLEAEDYSELLAQFRRFAREVIPRHGGSVARLQGDGLLAIFGHLEPREDDGRRATEAALELHDAVAQLRAGSGPTATTLQLHSGIHAGLVLVIEGDIERGRFDVVGEVPNTASRLCALAATGQILVSEETLGPQAHFFNASTLRRLVIRGRAEPLNVLRIDGRASVERRFDAASRRGVLPFVGRKAALAELLAAAERARRGESPLVVVSGEPGIGKTRLVEEFQRRLEPDAFHVLQGYCESYLGAEPLQPFMQWIRGALGRQAPLTDDEALSPAAQALLGGAGTRASPHPVLLVTAIIELIGMLARQHTLVLVLDDWQWADDASRQALETLLARQMPVLVIVATRPSKEADPGLADARTLLLQPFDAVDSADAIAAWLPSVEPFVTQEIVRQSGGSPLFIEELCHAAAQGDFHATARRASAAWINALVASRLSRLPEAQAEVLRAASVAGNVFPDWLLERMVGEDAAAPLLQALSATDFLVAAGQPGMLRFKHLLTRDAVYGTVHPARRRALHLRVGQVLEEVGNQDAFEWLEALSYHYDAAGVSDKAAQYAEAAGDKALAAMATDRARVHYLTALRSLDALPQLTRPLKVRWCALAQKLGQACVFDPLDVTEGSLMFERAARLARETGDQNAIARAEYWLGYVNYGRGRPRVSVQHCETALTHALVSEDLKLVAQVEATLGQALASAGRYDRALPLLTRAVESKRQQSRPGSGTAVGSAYTLARIAYTLGDLGRFDEAHATFAEAQRLLGDKEHSVGASVLELVCAVHLWQGRWEEARRAGIEGSEIALRCRSRYLVAMGRALAACGGWALQEDPASLQVLREATQWIEERGGAVSTSLNHGWLLVATVRLGLEQEARQHAVNLFRRARAEDRHGQAMGCRSLARLAAAHGDVPRALHYLALADRAAAVRDSPRERAVTQLVRAELAPMLGRAADAAPLASSAAEAFESMAMQFHLERARKVLRGEFTGSAGSPSPASPPTA
ncbi:AAA family ATPase [Caenimonas sedimenti]|uniref:AAA family ATPase n=1 Tax=Caenimonas sedimenti TaxID=2596921 RepID=A0A562ZT94_9BURK|nr:AAA family ATPase [Caenimonas sedimenti]TWO71713.1 AAA family ATPase [Caenimonas sedimenti]